MVPPLIAGLGAPIIAGMARQALSSMVWTPHGQQGIRYALGKAVNIYHSINNKLGPFGYGFLYAGGTVQGYHLNSAIYNKPFKYIGSPRRISKL